MMPGSVSSSVSPEVVDALDRIPELPFLTPGEGQRRGAGLGRVAAFGGIGFDRRRRHRLVGTRLDLEAGKQAHGFSNQRAVEVGEDAVEIEAETE